MELAEATVESETNENYREKDKQGCKVDGRVHVLITHPIQVPVVRKDEVVDTQLEMLWCDDR